MIVSGENEDEIVVVVGLFVVVVGLLVVGFVVGLFVGTVIVGVSGRGTNGLYATDGPG